MTLKPLASNNDNTKSPWQSLTLRGLFLLLLVWLKDRYKVDVTGLQIEHVVDGIAGAIAIIMTVYGRYRAKSPISIGHSGPVMILVVSFSLAAVLGCASSPRDRYYQAESSLTTARTTIIELYGGGFIDDHTLFELDRLEKQARAALRVARTHVEDKDQTEFRRFMDLVDNILTELIEVMSTKAPKETSNGPSINRHHDDPGKGFNQGDSGSYGQRAGHDKSVGWIAYRGAEKANRRDGRAITGRVGRLNLAA